MHNAIVSHHLFNLSPSLYLYISLPLVLETQEQDFEVRFSVVCVLVRLLGSLLFVSLSLSLSLYFLRHTIRYTRPLYVVHKFLAISLYLGSHIHR